MTQRRFCTAVVLGLVALSGCAPVISSEWRKEARKDLTFATAFHDPAAYTGSIVIWGGIIIGVANRPEGTALTVLETPLSYRERPEHSERSRGRFIAVTSQFLDPAVYSRGRKVTVAGEIIGKETKPMGKSKVPYTYPVVRIKQIHLWSIRLEYVPPPDYWWYGGFYDYWPDEGFDEGLGEDEGEGEGMENNNMENGERGRE